MSWEVGDEEWLADPVAVSGSGPLDAFDERVLALFPAAGADPAPAGPAAPTNDVAEAAPASDAAAAGSTSDAVEPIAADDPVEAVSLPPPPYSAAFDEHGDQPSYESSSFVADPGEPGPPNDVSVEAAPPVTEGAPSAEEEQLEPALDPGFHIPTLSLSVQSAVSPPVVRDPEVSPPVVGAPEVSVSPPVDGAPAVSPPAVSPPAVSPPQASPGAAGAPSAASVAVSPPGAAASPPAAAVAPAVSPPAATPPAAASPATVPDPVVATPASPAQPDPGPAPDGASFLIPTLSRPEIEHSVTESVPISDASVDGLRTADQGAAGHPETLERVDSSELELVAEDDEVAADGDPQEPVGFVIPTLARPGEPAPVEPVPALDAVADQPTLDVLFPSLAYVEDSPAAPAVEASRVVEEVEEVEADAIESLDTEDLEEVEHRPPSEEAAPPSPPPDPQPKRRKAWYDDVFGEHFLSLLPPTWEETAARDAEFIYTQFGLDAGASVLDVGCGDGRHAIELAKLGLRVTGLDNSLALLLAAAQNKEAAELEEGSVEFMHGDMRRLPRDRQFDAVLCVGSSFGYFEEEQNRQCLQEMYDRLAVGGRLLLHVFNRDFVVPHLPSRSWWQGKRCMVIDEAEMNFFANRLRIHRTVIFDDGRQYEHYMFMRAYTVQDLGKAMSQAGMRVIEVSGSRDTRGRFYGSASPDIWIVAERK